MKLSDKNKLIILKHFASYKARMHPTSSIVLQSLPIYGVQVDEHFYSLDIILIALKPVLEKHFNLENKE
jgi:hypothetical protein